MDPHMAIPRARNIARKPIDIGKVYRFYSDCVECKSDNDIPIRRYSGQEVEVISVEPADEGEGETLYNVRARNGDTFSANAGELNGWIFDTGQWVGPRTS